VGIGLDTFTGPPVARQVGVGDELWVEIDVGSPRRAVALVATDVAPVVKPEARLAIF
jgi:hypothetical protein